MKRIRVQVEKADSHAKRIEREIKGTQRMIALTRTYRKSLDGIFKTCSFALVNRSDNALSANFEEPLRAIYKEYKAIREVEDSTKYLREFLEYEKKEETSTPTPTPKVAKVRDEDAIRLLSFKIQLNDVKVRKVEKGIKALEAGEKDEKTLTRLISLSTSVARLKQAGKKMKGQLQQMQE